jgi:hypothetical protein
MQTPPSQYQGAFPEQIRVSLVNGDRGTLREAYIREGVLYGWGWQEGAPQGQRFGFALSDVERIEVRNPHQGTTIAGLTLAAWCAGAMIAERPCFWPIFSDD